MMKMRNTNKIGAILSVPLPTKWGHMLPLSGTFKAYIHTIYVVLMLPCTYICTYTLIHKHTQKRVMFLLPKTNDIPTYICI